MSKPDINRPKLIALCRAFIEAANERSNELSFRPLRVVGITDDQVLVTIKQIFTDHHRGFHFPTTFGEEHQNSVALKAFQESGVTYDEVRQSLKNERLDQLLTLLGRAARLG